MLKKCGDVEAAFLSKGFDKKSNVAQDPDQLSLLNIGRDYVCPRKEDLMKEIFFTSSMFAKSIYQNPSCSMFNQNRKYKMQKVVAKPNSTHITGQDMVLQYKTIFFLLA